MVSIIFYLLIVSAQTVNEPKICPIYDTLPEENAGCVLEKGKEEDYLLSPSDDIPVYNHPQICDQFENIKKNGEFRRELTPKEQETFEFYHCPLG